MKQQRLNNGINLECWIKFSKNFSFVFSYQNNFSIKKIAGWKKELLSCFHSSKDEPDQKSDDWIFHPIFSFFLFCSYEWWETI